MPARFPCMLGAHHQSAPCSWGALVCSRSSQAPASPSSSQLLYFKCICRRGFSLQGIPASFRM